MLISESAKTSHPQKLSELSSDIEISQREKLQAETLNPVVTFFVRANGAVGGAIFALALIEHFLPSPSGRIVTEKVLIALIVGLTLQVGAVIIAAFRGLFDPRASRETQPSHSRRSSVARTSARKKPGSGSGLR